MSAPLVSVLIPTYNSAKFLEEAIESVLNQTLRDFELIIVDDGSEDKIQDVIKRFDGRLQYHKRPHEGRPAARNVALELARGEYVAFLDADDLWEENRLARGVSVLNESPEIGLVHGEITVIDEAGQLVPQETRRAKRLFQREHAKGAGYFRLLDAQSLILSSTVLFRKKCLEQVGRFDPAFPVYEDYDWYLRFAFYFPFFLLDGPAVTKYRLHAKNSFTEFNSESVAKIYLSILEKQLVLLQKDGDSARNRTRRSRVLKKMTEFHWRLKEKKEVKNKLLEAARLDSSILLDWRVFQRFIFSL